MTTETAPALDERALRKPDFKEGVPLVMGDGSAWHVRRPFIVAVPAETEAGYDLKLSYRDWKVDGLVKAVVDVAAAGDDVATVGPLMKLSRALLEINYDLTLDGARKLLSFDANDPAGMKRLVDCYLVTRGIDPAATTPAPDANTGADQPAEAPAEAPELASA